MQAQGRERYRMLRFRFDIAIMYLLVVVDIFFTVFLSLLTMVTYGWLPTARSATSEDDVYLFHGGNAREKALSRKASSFLPRAKRRRRRRRLDLARRISLPTSSSNHASSGKEGGGDSSWRRRRHCYSSFVTRVNAPSLGTTHTHTRCKYTTSSSGVVFLFIYAVTGGVHPPIRPSVAVKNRSQQEEW